MDKLKKLVRELANDLLEGFTDYQYSVNDIEDILYRIMYETNFSIYELWEMNNQDSTLVYHLIWLHC